MGVTGGAKNASENVCGAVGDSVGFSGDRICVVTTKMDGETWSGGRKGLEGDAGETWV